MTNTEFRAVKHNRAKFSENKPHFRKRFFQQEINSGASAYKQNRLAVKRGKQTVIFTEILIT